MTDDDERRMSRALRAAVEAGDPSTVATLAIEMARQGQTIRRTDEYEAGRLAGLTEAMTARTEIRGMGLVPMPERWRRVILNLIKGA